MQCIDKALNYESLQEKSNKPSNDASIEFVTSSISDTNEHEVINSFDDQIKDLANQEDKKYSIINILLSASNLKSANNFYLNIYNKSDEYEYYGTFLDEPLSELEYYGYIPYRENPTSMADRLFGVPDPRLVEDY